MKIEQKRGWRSLVPHYLRARPSTRFCMFHKVQSSSYSPCETPVYLNVYDLTAINGYVYWAGLGIFHSGLEVDGVEYAFGAHDLAASGVFEIEPRQCPGFKFRKSIYMGSTYMDPFQVREFVEQQSAHYYGNSYHLVVKNCNHFCEDICYQLTGNRIPKWVNRLANIGSLCHSILPEALKTPAIRREPDFRCSDDEKKSLTNAFSCFTSMSMHHKEREVSINSLFLHSHYKGCLPPWENKKSDDDSEQRS
nr:PREDICTED: deSI-like protein At4g17486 isoform X2 [Daucus carota subsp. sativus]